MRRARARVGRYRQARQPRRRVRLVRFVESVRRAFGGCKRVFDGRFRDALQRASDAELSPDDEPRSSPSIEMSSSRSGQ